MTTNPCDEMESGCVISDSRRGGYSLARSGRYVGDFNEYVNDHGNVDLLTLGLALQQPERKKPCHSAN